MTGIPAIGAEIDSLVVIICARIMPEVFGKILDLRQQFTARTRLFLIRAKPPDLA
jgi:hypothetical protein